jgi:hypothetical protein
MLHVPDIVRLLAVFACSGIFWMMILFLVDRVSMDQARPGAIPLAILVLVVSAYFLIDVVSHNDAVALLVPAHL